MSAAPISSSREPSIWVMLGPDDVSNAEIRQNGGSHSVAADPAASIRKEIEQRKAFDEGISRLSQVVFSKNELLKLSDEASEARSNAEGSTEYKVILEAYCLTRAAGSRVDDLVFITWNKACIAGGELPAEPFESFKTEYSVKLTSQGDELARRLDSIENFFNE